ncbi:A-kinase anchor protein 13, partial [Galemys pyrenaicus]
EAERALCVCYNLCSLACRENAGEPDSWSSLSYEIPCGDCSVRHHRELDIYTLTSESESQHEPPRPGDPCTGHISKLMNIQQQLAKTNLKQMDSLLPLMVTARDPPRLPSSPAASGQCRPCASEPSAGQQLSPEDAESSPGRPWSPAGQIGQSSDVSGVRRENTDCSCQKTSKGVEREGEKAEPTPAVDAGAVSEPHSGGEHAGGPPSCGSINGDPGTESSAEATDQASPRRSNSTLQGDLLGEPGSAPPLSAGPVIRSTAGAAEPGLKNPEEATPQKTELERTSTGGASDVQVTSQPASVPSSDSAAVPLGGSSPAKSSLVLVNGAVSTEKASDSETSGSCDDNDAALGSPDVLGISPAAETKTSDGSEASSPSAAVCEAMSASDLAFSRAEAAISLYQKQETKSPHSQSQMSESPRDSTEGQDRLSVASTCPQDTVTSRVVLQAKPCEDPVTLPERAPPELPGTQPRPTAFCCEDPRACTVTPGHIAAAQVPVDCRPLQVLGEEGQGKDLKLEASVANTPEVVPHSIVAQTAEELVPRQRVTSDRTVSLAGGAGGESITKDDVLSLVPSQKEKGTPTPERHTAAERSDGTGGQSPDGAQQPLDGRAAGPSMSAAALGLQPGMGNASPSGLGAERQGSADPCLLPVEKAALVSDAILTEEGKNLVVSESSAAQGQEDKDKAVTSSSLTEGPLSSGTLPEEQRAPSAPEAQGSLGEPDSAACAEDRALHGSSLGTPSARPHAQREHNQEVAPPGSRLPEGGAAPGLVPPGASLTGSCSLEASGAAQSSFPLLPALLPDGSGLLDCHLSSALDVGVKGTQNQGENSACERSGAVAATSAPPGPTGARRKGSPPSTQDRPIPEHLLGQENSLSRDVPGASPDKDVTDQQAAAAPEMVPFGAGREKLEGAERHGHLGSPEEANTDGGAQHAPLQPAARQPRTEPGLSEQTPRRGRRALLPPGPVSATAVPPPQGADAFEEAASRIVDAVIERVKASAVLVAKGGVCRGPQSSPREWDPAAGQLAGVSADHPCACLPGATPQVGSTVEEAPGALAGCCAGREEPEQLTPSVQGPGLAAAPGCSA